MSEAEARYRAWAQFVDDHPELAPRHLRPRILSQADTDGGRMAEEPEVDDSDNGPDK